MHVSVTDVDIPDVGALLQICKLKKHSTIEDMQSENLPSKVPPQGVYTECLPTLRDAKTVANLAAMVDTSALYWADPSEFSPNRVCRLLPSSVVKVRLSIVSSSTFTCDRFDDTTQESQGVAIEFVYAKVSTAAVAVV